jgi:hypothetical protein
MLYGLAKSCARILEIFEFLMKLYELTLIINNIVNY